jgi:large subunit ribosomal protein L17
MRHRVAGRQLNRPTAHRMAMLRNMVTDLLRYETIRTTDAKAREVRRLADKSISLGKKGTLSSRRRAIAMLTDKDVVRKLFDELAPRYEDRPGGYTRIVKLTPRKGDAADMAVVELVP